MLIGDGMTDPTPLTDAELAEMQARCDAANGPDGGHMRSCCTEYQCDCHDDLPRLIAEIRRLNTWPGIMSVVDKHYPADVFTGASGDPGPTIVALMREITTLRATLELIGKSHRQESST